MIAALLENIINNKIVKLLINFVDCWIPDFPGKENLSGDLSHLKQIKPLYKFIGPLSRFSPDKSKSKLNEKFDIIAIISGPEPQRSIFEKLVLDQIKYNQLKAIIVRGLPDNKEETLSYDDVMVFNHLPTKELQNYIHMSKVVICRAGYSSIMDLITLRKKAIIVPTPGQTEQEYLAKYHLSKNNFYTQNQSKLNLSKGLVCAKKMSSLPKLKEGLTLNLI